MKKTFVILCTLFFFSTQLTAQDLYEINWTVEGTPYEACVIVYNNSYGMARVKYLRDGKKTIVEEGMEYESKNRGFNLYGSKPVYPGTQIEYKNYIADDFLITFESDGRLTVICADGDGNSLRIQQVGTSIQIITKKRDKVRFLKTFDWKL